LSQIQKTAHIGNWICSCPERKGKEAVTQLGLTGRASLLL